MRKEEKSFYFLRKTIIIIVYYIIIFVNDKKGEKQLTSNVLNALMPIVRGSLRKIFSMLI